MDEYDNDNDNDHDDACGLMQDAVGASDAIGHICRHDAAMPTLQGTFNDRA